MAHHEHGDMVARETGKIGEDAVQRRRPGDRHAHFFLELASPRVSKGSGMAFLAEHLGFTAAETVAFGDGENDLELLGWAGYGVCVENGHEELKARADFICPGPQEEGVAQSIEAYLTLDSNA